MYYCEIADCAEADNRCIDCKYEKTCDYPWVAKLWKANATLLTPLMPGWVKPEFRKNKIISVTRESDFCIFNIPKYSDFITIQDICVDKAARGKGISKQILNDLMVKYDRDILAKCIKGSSAENFWAHLGEKISEEPSKQSIVCTYVVLNKDKKIQKERLF